MRRLKTSKKFDCFSFVVEAAGPPPCLFLELRIPHAAHTPRSTTRFDLQGADDGRM